MKKRWFLAVALVFVCALGYFFFFKASFWFGGMPNVLYITSVHPSKTQLHLKGTKISDPKEVQNLYSMLKKARNMPRGRINCPSDFGASYKLRFQSPFQTLRIVADPTGCREVTFNRVHHRMLWDNAALFWKTLAKDLQVPEDKLTGVPKR